MRYPLAMAPFNRILISRRFCPMLSRGGRPGEKRTLSARLPPRARALRQRMTELAAHPTNRATSLSERPWSMRRSALRRRDSISSADPLGLGIGILQSIAEGFRVNETQSGTLVSFRIPIDADRRSGSVNQSRI